MSSVSSSNELLKLRVVWGTVPTCNWYHKWGDSLCGGLSPPNSHSWLNSSQKNILYPLNHCQLDTLLSEAQSILKDFPVVHKLLGLQTLYTLKKYWRLSYRLHLLIFTVFKIKTERLKILLINLFKNNKNNPITC